MKINRYRIPVEMKFTVMDYLISAGYGGEVGVHCLYDGLPDKIDEEAIMEFIKRNSPPKLHSYLSWHGRSW